VPKLNISHVFTKELSLNKKNRPLFFFGGGGHNIDLYHNIGMVFKKNANFFRRKIAKIAENCDRNIRPLVARTSRCEVAEIRTVAKIFGENFFVKLFLVPTSFISHPPPSLDCTTLFGWLARV
jgi:hypothetical protein